MAILITAPLGTGKTLYTIELIFEYLNQGRPVYSNIVGLKIPGVINVESTSQSPFDWRDLPNDAVLVYDEAHEHPAYSERDLLKNLTIEEYEKRLKEAENLDLPDTKKKSLISTIEREYSKALRRKKEQILDIGLSMSMHRHFGQEILLITQNPTKLNKDVLGNVTIHYVMRRKFGFEAANIWTFGEAMTTWGKSVADSALEKKYWRFPKHLYKFYVSSEKHNMKKYFPKKYYAFACIPLLIFYLGYSKASDTGFFGLIPKKEQETQLTHNVVKPVEGKTKQDLHDEIQAEKLGLTLDQYRDLKNPQANNEQNLELTQNSLHQITAQYKASDPFDYSYMQAPPVTAYQVFSGCFNGVAYDTQGTILHDAPKDLCKRVMAGDRPFNPYRNTNNAMVTQDSITQDYSQAAEQTVQQVQLTPDELAKFQQAKEMGLI
ncbi:hypothetical protein HYG89_05590 [Acinetobacter sp. SwsAc5]|uniref:zonular occludens toxin domain-containing protein n=1 Tax=Acinetobacter sp. SwsAc5 TaxID=2749438 RepID=UPI0015BACBBA|nr:zonular occludens toxin domain-containing protein [Acinetobacter sp. SwsAc5]NWK52040.1 hypothetical protein [Acinetobacter sp. SwsAc5]